MRTSIFSTSILMMLFAFFGMVLAVPTPSVTDVNGNIVKRDPWCYFALQRECVSILRRRDTAVVAASVVVEAKSVARRDPWCYFALQRECVSILRRSVGGAPAPAAAIDAVEIPTGKVPSVAEAEVVVAAAAPAASKKRRDPWCYFALQRECVSIL